MDGPRLRRVPELPPGTPASSTFPEPGATPLLVRGAVRRWPTWESWTFGGLADYCDRHAPGVSAWFQTGVVEHADTPAQERRPVTEFLRGLEGVAAEPDRRCFVARHDLAAAGPSDPLPVDWTCLADRPAPPYLQVWDMFAAVPEIRSIVPSRVVWPGARFTWAYAFAGPADTFTGLHYDISNNWFCQMQGEKEFILFPRTESSHLRPSTKFDWGAKLSEIDFSHPERLSAQAWRDISVAQGWYARVGAGDALYLPGGTWHAVSSLTPSLSVGIFGLRTSQLFTDGLPMISRKALHAAHLYRRGNCVCHGSTRAPVEVATA